MASWRWLVDVGEGGTADVATGNRSWRRPSMKELSALLVSSLGLWGSGPALSWAKVPLNSRPTEAPSMVPIGLREGYREQRSWLRHQLMLSRAPSYVVAA